MSSVVDEANAYFASLSNVAARVYADVELVKQACLASGEWDELSTEDQELITDQVLIDSQVLEKYSSSATKNDEYPNCFPVLKLPSGEKIVVDFENDDGSTWADEHSGPFSWKTKSQQDLSLDDLDDTKDTLSKRSRFVKRLHSPDRSVWDTSVFFPGGGSKNEIEKMFEKFKIKMAADEEGGNFSDRAETEVRSTVRDGINDSDFSPGHSEYSKLIGDVNKAYTSSADDDIKHTITVKESDGRDSEKTTTGNKKKKKHKKDKERKSRHSKSRSKNGAELGDAAVVSAGTQSAGQLAMPQSLFVTNSGQTIDSDVYTPSATDTGQLDLPSDLPSIHASCHSSVVSKVPSESIVDDVGSVDGNPLDYSTAELIPPTPTREADIESRSATIKSGFEFLDEW